MKKTMLAVALALASTTYAGPKTFVKGIGHEVKMTAVDVKRHPFAWGVPMALQLGIAFSDTATSCIGFSQGMIEAGPAKYFIGRHPNCRKAVLLTSVVMATHITAEHALSNLWTDSCYREAAKPDSLWWKVDAHTHNPESCRWNIPYMDTLALGAIEIHTIEHNISIIERK